MAYVARREQLSEVATDIRTIFNAPDRPTAEAHLAKAVQKYGQCASRLADGSEKIIPEGLTAFDFPAAHRRKIGTTNGLERVNREVRRRTQVSALPGMSRLPEASARASLPLPAVGSLTSLGGFSHNQQAPVRNQQSHRVFAR